MVSQHRVTGAGTRVTEALLKDETPPEEFLGAMHTICERAQAKYCRIWIDAEQQLLQTAIDRWTIDLMRRYNRSSNNRSNDNQALVYNTLQAYLKASREKLQHQLALADREGWTLAIKLVRGAYMCNDHYRARIHDTKANTDASYDGIVRDLLQGTNLGFAPDKFPPMQLFLAGHNPDSVATASELVASLAAQRRLKVLPDFGQLQGMADLLGCELLARCEEMDAMRKAARRSGGGGGDSESKLGQEELMVVPKVYKCLTWGSVQECIQYLLRRMIENSGGSDRLRDGLSAYSAELRRRIFRSLFPFR